MTSSEKTRVISDTLKITLAQFISFPLAMLVAYFTARKLGPELLGVVSALAVILKYTASANLGALNALNREVPYNIGKGNLKEADSIRSVVLGQMILTAVVLCAGILVASVFLAHSGLFKIGLAFTAFFVFFQQLDAYFNFYLRSAKEFAFFSKLTILRAVVRTVFAVALILLFGIIGLWSSTLIVYLAALVFVVFIGKKLRVRPSLDFKKVISLIKIGLPIYIVGTLFAFYLTIDRLIIIKFLSIKSLGLYSLTKMVHQTALLAVPLVGQVMYPRFAEHYGRTRDYKSLRRYVEEPMIVLSHITPVLIGVLFLLLPVLIGKFLPHYTDGIVAAQIYCGGLFFFALMGMAANFLITTNRLIPYIVIVISAMITDVVLCLIFVHLGWGINGVALGVTTSFMLLAILLISYVYRFFISSLKEFRSFAVRLLLPFAANIVMIGLIYFAIPVSTLTGMGDWGTLAFRLVVLISLNVPFIYLAERKTGILVVALALFKKRLRPGI